MFRVSTYFPVNATLLRALPLRPRKLARTRLALLHAAVEALRTQRLEDVAVKGLCEAAQVSEASFFNYFPKKSDLLVYFVQLWSAQMAWHAQRLAREKGGLAAVEAVFALTAEKVADHPAVMAEVLAFQARREKAARLPQLSLAERLLAFPDLEGIGDVPGMGLDALIPPLLEQAVAAGELPRGADLKQALLGVASVFFGVPLALLGVDPGAVGPAYRAQLALLWGGLRTSAGHRPASPAKTQTKTQTQRRRK